MNVPILKGCADGLDFALDGLLDGVEDDPGVAGGEDAFRGVVSNKTAGLTCRLM